MNINNISISIGGEGTYPKARDAVTHTVAEPEHRVVLAVSRQWWAEPPVFEDQEDALHWLCLTCGQPAVTE